MASRMPGSFRWVTGMPPVHAGTELASPDPPGSSALVASVYWGRSAGSAWAERRPLGQRGQHRVSVPVARVGRGRPLLHLLSGPSVPTAATAASCSRCEREAERADVPALGERLRPGGVRRAARRGAACASASIRSSVSRSWSGRRRRRRTPSPCPRTRSSGGAGGSPSQPAQRRRGPAVMRVDGPRRLPVISSRGRGEAGGDQPLRLVVQLALGPGPEPAEPALHLLGQLVGGPGAAARAGRGWRRRSVVRKRGHAAS